MKKIPAVKQIEMPKSRPSFFIDYGRYGMDHHDMSS